MAPAFKETAGDNWRTELEKAMASTLNTTWIEAADQANAALWLASEESRFVTGQSIVVDVGWGTWTR